MKTTPLLIAATLAILLVPAFAQDDQDGQARATRIPAPDSLFDRATFRPFGAPEIEWLGMSSDPEYAEPHSTASLLEDTLDPARLGLEGTSYASAGDLMVDGPPATVNEIRRQMAAIERFLEGRAVLRVAALHVRDAADASSAGAVRTAATEGRADALWSGRVSLRRGEPIVQGETELLTFVADHDVEVAQGASIADPNLATLQTGVRIALQQRALDATHALVNVSFQYADVADVATVVVGAGTIEQPRVPFACATTSLLVEKDVPQLLTLSHPSQPGVLALVIEAVQLPADEETAYRLLDTAAYTASGLRAPHLPMGVDDGPFCDEGDAGYIAPYGEAEDLRTSLEDADQGEELSRATMMLPRTTRTPNWPQPETLSRRTWRITRDQLVALPEFDPIDNTVSPDAAEALATRTPDVEMRIPTVDRGGVHVSIGELTRVITDFDVEIASTAAITDPIVMSLVEGDRVVRPHARAGSPLDSPIAWTVVRVLERSVRPIIVRKDINGVRNEEQVDRIDVVRHRITTGRAMPAPDARLDVRRVGDGYEIDVWEEN